MSKKMTKEEKSIRKTTIIAEAKLSQALFFHHEETLLGLDLSPIEIDPKLVIIAAKCGNLDVLRLLVENQAPVNVIESQLVSDNGVLYNTALDIATNNGYLDIIDYLRESGGLTYAEIIADIGMVELSGQNDSYQQ